jgi:purine nucleosidase
VLIDLTRWAAIVAGAAVVCSAPGRAQTPSGSPASSASRPAAAERPAVVLVADVGADMDDEWALAHLVLSPEIDLRGVITTHTFRLTPPVARQNAIVVLDNVGLSESARPSVIPGAGSRLVDMKTPQPSAGVDYLLQLSSGFSETKRLYVLVTGAATEVASAILRDPTISRRISIVAMGFSDWDTGGSEFNVNNDPEAWRVVLDADVPLVIGSGVLTRRDLRLTRDEARALVASRGRLGAFLFGRFDGWVTQNASLVASMVAPETWVVWDEVVVAHLLGMTTGEERSRPQMGANRRFVHNQSPQKLTWLTQIDHARLWGDLTRKLDGLSSDGPSVPAARRQ